MKSILNFFSALTLGLILSCLPMVLRAQVTDVKYYIKYNSTFCYYEAHVLVTAGSASGSNADAANCQFSIVVPHGTTLTKVADNQPVNKTTSVPSVWNVPSNRLNAPAVNTAVDYIAFTLNAGNGAYPTLSVNTDLVLFTFTLSSTACGAGNRMWINNAFDGNADPGSSSTWDPVPSASGMGFNDFNNSFTLGTVGTERYRTGNATSTVTPPSPSIASVVCASVGGSFSLTGTATPGSACAATLSYSWAGPGGYTATGATFVRPSATAAMSGNYTLTVKDPNGCPATAINCFNALTCVSCNAPLAIKLNSFEGSASKCVAVLNWEAQDLKGLRDFEVQYSSDGNKYTTVGVVNTDQGVGGQYTFRYNQDGGAGYYRLKMVNVSGDDTYSKTVTVTTDCKNQIITVSPNPTTGVIYVKGVNAGDEVKVVDMLGQVVASTTATGNVATTNLSRLPAAVYMVIVVQDNNIIKVGQVVNRP